MVKRSRGATRSRQPISQATRKISAAVGVRKAISANGLSSRSASLATTPSDANMSWTATSATCTDGFGSRGGVGVIVATIVGAALDAVLAHQLAEVLAVDVGLAR